MCAPVALRIRESFTERSRSPAATAGAAATGAGRRRGRRCGGGRSCRRCGSRGRRGSRRWCTAAGALVDVVEHVVAGDPPARTGAGDLVGVQPVLGDEPAHDG